MIDALSQGTLQRLPQYLIMLKAEQNENRTAVTADEIGSVVRVSPSQVRHDLTACGMNRAPASAIPWESWWSSLNTPWAMTIFPMPSSWAPGPAGPCPAELSELLGLRRGRDRPPLIRTSPWWAGR